MGGPPAADGSFSPSERAAVYRAIFERRDCRRFLPDQAGGAPGQARPRPWPGEARAQRSRLKTGRPAAVKALQREAMTPRKELLEAPRAPARS